MDPLRCRPIARRHFGLGPLALAMPLALVLAACSGTPFGDQLSGSFPDGEAPAAGTAAAPPAAGAPAGGDPAPAAGPGAAAPGAPQTGAAASPQPAAPAAAAPPPAAPAAQAAAAAPAPYRLTLRLTAADPAAPAEAVTRALRTAGLAFEVEVIERIPEAAAPADPAAAPASR
ncbi:MAG: hypothetical protein AAFX65_06575 [Cyanobacteria bacterium J06638_7]